MDSGSDVRLHNQGDAVMTMSDFKYCGIVGDDSRRTEYAFEKHGATKLYSLTFNKSEKTFSGIILTPHDNVGADGFREKVTMPEDMVKQLTHIVEREKRREKLLESTGHEVKPTARKPPDRGGWER
jgi:hypothetical protein